MQGIFIGRGVDVEERLKRMRKSSFILRKRFKNSKLSKRHQAKIVELCIESTGLSKAMACSGDKKGAELC